MEKFYPLLLPTAVPIRAPGITLHEGQELLIDFKPFRVVSLHKPFKILRVSVSYFYLNCNYKYECQ